MIDDLVGSGVHSEQEELRRTRHEDMIWFGPCGIGATYTLGRYETQHQRPFRSGLADIVFEGHLCHVDEGRYGGFFGWPNLSMRASGGFPGLPACERRTEMRVVDLYRRDGDKLAENWIFIDLPHFLALQGLDVLARMRELSRHGRLSTDDGAGPPPRPDPAPGSVARARRCARRGDSPERRVPHRSLRTAPLGPAACPQPPTCALNAARCHHAHLEVGTKDPLSFSAVRDRPRR